jgi:5-methyltetrahydrofolate--homocysteine methyltransferase
LDEGVVVLDGGMGTVLQGRGLSADDFGGKELEGCNEALNLFRPDLIEDVHDRYLEAGARVVTTNTFGAMPLVLKEYGLEGRAREAARAGAAAARKAADRWTESEGVRFVAGSLGPTTKSLSLTGGVSFEQMAASYAEGVRGLMDGGADFLLFETAMDSLNLKAAFEGADRVFSERGERVPVMVSVTIEKNGTMLAGQDVEAALYSFIHRPLLAFGINCSTGPDLMTESLRTLAEVSPFPSSCYPNAGLPDEHGRYTLSPAGFARAMGDFVDRGWLNLAGGCCGTTPAHIRALAEVVRGGTPRSRVEFRRTVLSGVEPLALEHEQGPYLVGERTNSLGSRRFRRLVSEGRLAEAAEMGRRQLRSGAHLLDVCLQNPDRDEKGDMSLLLERLRSMVRAPLMLDTTDLDVLEAALIRVQGRCAYNSVNLEDGGERLQGAVGLARRFGIAIVFGCIVEQEKGGMAIERGEKLAAAERGYEVLVDRLGMEPEEVIFDPLVFPCGTGDERYRGSARETIEGVRLIKERFPRCLTICGVSNVSFGLPSEARPVLNSVFLHECLEAGLDMAIVDARRVVRHSEISDEDLRVCMRLIDDRPDDRPKKRAVAAETAEAGEATEGAGPEAAGTAGGRERGGERDPIAELAAHFRGRKRGAGRSESEERSRRALSPAQRAARSVVEGSFEGLGRTLDELLLEMSALDIINGPLLQGMAEVGELFEKNELIVAEVLQSAEVMKKAVSHLEPHLEEGKASVKGTALLATVKGDVHDIGKSLVHIIFENNGYRVVDLGIKVPPERIIEACREHDPDLICLSGLLVRSAQQMIATADDLQEASIGAPIMVGGAALSESFARDRIGPAYPSGRVSYAKDAMKGLALADELIRAYRRGSSTVSGSGFEEGATKELAGTAEGAGKAEAEAEGAGKAAAEGEERAAEGRFVGGRVEVTHDFSPPRPPDLEIHEFDEPFSTVAPFLNQKRILRKHLGLSGRIGELIEAGDRKAVDAAARVAALIERVEAEQLIRVRGVYRFFAAGSRGDELLFFGGGGEDGHGREGAEGVDEGAGPVARFSFPRQRGKDGLCAADFVHPVGAEGRPEDYVAVFALSCGWGRTCEVSVLASEWREEGRYIDAVVLQALALEGAEAAAEWLHSELRRMWSIEEDEAARTAGKHRGVRLSFGMPCCPDLSLQRQLFSALEVSDRTGIRLTEGDMMEPEPSVTALVFHHPQARHFSV